MGLDSPFFIYNMGTVMVQILAIAGIIAASSLWRACMYRHKWFKKRWRGSEGTAFWTGPILLVQENYGILTLAGLLTVVDVSSFVSHTNLCFAA